MRKRLAVVALIGAVAMSVSAWGQSAGRGRGPGATPEGTPSARGTAPDGTPAQGGRPVDPRNDISITTATVNVAAPNGATRPLTYTAVAGYMPLKDEQDKLRANIYYTAYTVGGSGPATAQSDTAPATRPAGATAHAPLGDPNRPLLFAFNGGPGAASAWLHLGAVGPRRVDVPEDGGAPKAPFKVVDNDYTWLGAADLVFVDPVNTGFSRAATPEQAREFFGVQEDIQAMGEFIRLYITRNGRWGSPIFIAGESYGTTRAAGLSSHLLDRVGVSASGIILVSTVLNFAVLSPGENNDLPYALYLPSYAATAWYHKKAGAGRSWEDLRKDVESYAGNEYLVALARGGALTPDERTKVATRLAELTGLSKEYLLQSNLRVQPARFQKELLKSPTGEGSKIVGRFDGRMAGFPTDPSNDSQEYDPSLTGFYAAYTSAFNDYVRRQLKFESDLPYEILSGRVQPWNYASGGAGGGSGYLYVGDDLRDAMIHNPRLKVLVCSGWYDMATPYFATDYQMEHMTLAPDVRKNITTKYYEGGHMMYHVRESLVKLQGDVAGFVESSR
jgi:carboxypeptidase C (cathepsin A)